MKETDFKEPLPSPSESVKLEKPIGRKLFRLLAFLVCIAVLVAAFAATAIWASFSAPVQTFLDGIFRRDRITEQTAEETPDIAADPEADPEPEDGSLPVLPENVIPVVSKTLIEPMQPDVQQTSFSNEKALFFGQTPVVFLYCSNPKEAYLQEEETLLEGKVGEATFSDDPSRTVRKVAEKLLNFLSESGISAIYGEPEEGDGYLGSSGRAGELLQKALAENPQITLVIEIGRDSLFDADGNYIKTVAQNGSDQTAQILAVVGSEASGSLCPAWQENLELAQVLGATMETAVPGIFRGIRVSSTPQDQQYVFRSLSLSVGSGANSMEEAERAAERIGEALIALLNHPK